MKRVLIVLSLILISGCCKEELEDIIIIDPEPPVETVLGNYGSPYYSSINSTTDVAVSNRVRAGRFISHQEAVDKINIYDNGTYLLGDHAQVLFDYNGDGDLDLFGWLVNTTPDNTGASVTGPGKWVWWPNYDEEGSQPTYYESTAIWAPKPYLNDFNNDGTIDLVWQIGNLHDNGIGGFYGPAHELVIHELNENGFVERFIGSPTAPHGMATGDIDNDGDIDIISGEWLFGDCDHVSIPKFLINDGSGNFTETTDLLEEGSLFAQNNSCTDMAYTYVGLFDINNDGYLDLLTGYKAEEEVPSFLTDLYDTTGYSPSDITVAYGNGTGNFSLNNGFKEVYSTPTSALNRNTNAIMLGGNFADLNNDGYVEFIAVETYGYSGAGIRVYSNISGNDFDDVTSQFIDKSIDFHSGANGYFSQMQQGDLTISYNVDIVDIDNDGDYDIHWTWPVTEDYSSTIKVAYWENIGGYFTLVEEHNEY